MNSDGHSKDNKHKLHNFLVPCWVQSSKQKKCISRKDKFKYDPELTPWVLSESLPKIKTVQCPQQTHQNQSRFSVMALLL
jgi:hypothetical protein